MTRELLQVDKLERYLETFPEKRAHQYESAIDMAIRLLERYRTAFDMIVHELGVPNKDYPQNVANAADLAAGEFNGESQIEYVRKM